MQRGGGENDKAEELGEEFRGRVGLVRGTCSAGDNGESKERKRLGFLTGIGRGEKRGSPGERSSAIWDIGKCRVSGDNQGATEGPRTKAVGAR